MNTIENNKLIAEFEQKYSIGFGLYDFNGCHYKLDQLEFHKSWDWLMPLVDKIEREHKANFKIMSSWNEFNECSYYQVTMNIKEGTMSKDRACIYDPKKVYEHSTQTCRCKKKATYEAVIKFIKWYNKQS